MPLTPTEIKDKLTKALDDDKNVIDEEAVEEVITLLEASTLTKEILEQTRLGRDVNLLRKTSKNQFIAKRARNLIKAWNKLIQNPGSPQVANGQLRVSPGLSPALNKSGTPNKFLPSPALSQTKQQSIKSSNARGLVAQNTLRSNQPRSAKGVIPERKSKAGVTAKSPLAGTNQQPVASISINSNDGDSNLSWPRTPPCAPNENSQDRLEGDDNQSQSSAGSKNGNSGPIRQNFNFDHKHNHSTSESSKTGNRASDQRDVSKTNVANRKRTRRSALHDNSLESSPELPKSKHSCLMTNPRLSSPIDSKNDVINGMHVRKNSVKPSPLSLDSLATPDKKMVSSFYKGFGDQRDSSSLSLSQFNRLTSITDSHLSPQPSESRKIRRVKTTEQLIEDVQRKSATPVGTSVIAQIRTNQINKESDAQKCALPVGMKKRGRKKKNQNLDLSSAEPVSEVQQLAQTKSEYIERFLETSVAPTPGEDVYEPPIPNLRQESLDEHPIALGACSSTFSQSAYESGFSSYSSRQDKPDSGPSASPPEAREITIENGGHLPASNSVPLDVHAPPSERLSEAQLLAHLPHIDFPNIDWSSSAYSVPQSIPPTPEVIERLHNENIDGVNGTYDRDGQFQSWADMLTCDSVYDDPLFILPYVMPND